MTKSHDTDRYVAEPDQLVDLLRQVIERIDRERNTPERQEKEAQLKGIAKTIAQFEKSSIPVPDELRALKTGLVGQLGETGEATKKLKDLEKSLSEVLDEVRDFLVEGSGADGKRRRSHAPKTSRETLRQEIIHALKALDGRGQVQDIFTQMEKHLHGRLLPHDMDETASGDTIWENNTRWEHSKMIEEGILRDDAPRGVWELSKEYR